MAKFCGKCGSKLDEKTGLCPKCDRQLMKKEKKAAKKAGKKHVGLKITAILLWLIIILGGVLGALVYFDVLEMPEMEFRFLNEDDENVIESTLYVPTENSVSQDEETGIMYVNNIVLVFFEPTATDYEIEQLIESIDGKIVGKLESIDQYQIQIQKSSLEEIKEICANLEKEEYVVAATYDNVFFIKEDTVEVPNDPWTKKWYTKGETWSEENPEGDNWWLESTHILSAWQYNNKLEKIKIGIVDNGFDTGHEDLKNIIKDTSPVNNKEEHGTHVAGIIGAEANNKKGITGIVWNCELCTWDWQLNTVQDVVNKVFQLDWSTTNQILGGTVQLIENGAKVINVSAGQTSSMETLIRAGEEIDIQGYQASLYLHALLARGFDFVIVQSAGNGNAQNQSVDARYNGLYASISSDNCFVSDMISADDIIERIIIVGAAQNNGNNSYMQFPWSNAGDRVDICAPGLVYSTVPGGLFGKYATLPGTSMASPIVAGVVSLVWSANPDLNGKEVKEIVCDTQNTTYTVADNETDNHLLVNTYRMVDAKLAVEAAIKYSGEKEESTDNQIVLDEFPEVDVHSGERDIVLVLDTSGSMSGTPMEETKTASKRFVESILKEDASIGLVTYSDSAELVSSFSTSSTTLTNKVDEIYDGGGTNIEAGLETAYDMLRARDSKKKIIVLMSDGEPNTGKIGDELIEFAEQIKEDDVYIYTLGFFESLGSYKTDAQQLMEAIASDGCHYEVSDAESLVFFFGDIADQINGQKYIYIRIACPVDVTVSSEGETLCSREQNLNTRTDFGTLTFEENETDSEGESDNRIKVLRLKEGTDYDIEIAGNGYGRMNYTIGFMDEDGEYSDLRRFTNIKVTNRTMVDTVAKRAKSTVLNVDEDGDGKYDLKYKAEENSRGEIVDYTYVIYIAIVVLAFILIIYVTLKIRRFWKRRR